MSVYGYDNIRVDTYGFDGTLIWYLDNGFYVGGQRQVLWSNSDIYSHKL